MLYYSFGNNGDFIELTMAHYLVLFQAYTKYEGKEVRHLIATLSPFQKFKMRRKKNMTKRTKQKKERIRSKQLETRFSFTRCQRVE